MKQELIDNYYNKKDNSYYELRAAVNAHCDRLADLAGEILEKDVSFLDYSVYVGQETFKILWSEFEYEQEFKFEEIIDFDEEKFKKQFTQLVLRYLNEDLRYVDQRKIDLEIEIERLENLVSQK